MHLLAATLPNHLFRRARRTPTVHGLRRVPKESMELIAPDSLYFVQRPWHVRCSHQSEKVGKHGSRPRKPRIYEPDMFTKYLVLDSPSTSDATPTQEDHSCIAAGISLPPMTTTRENQPYLNSRSSSLTRFSRVRKSPTFQSRYGRRASEREIQKKPFVRHKTDCCAAQSS